MNPDSLKSVLPLVFLLATGNAAQALETPVLQVGLAKVDVTPQGPVQLINVKEPTESTGVEQPLSARALAIGEGPESVVLINFDGIGVPATLAQSVAWRLKEARRIPRERIAICATHTHWAPHLKDLLVNIYGGPLPEDHQRRVDAYTALLIDKLEEVAIKALDSRRASHVSWAVGRATFAINRRLEAGGQLLRDESKRLMVTWNPTAPVDHSLPVMVIRDAESGELRGLHFTYACHNVALTGTQISGFVNSIHGDWAGLAQDELEQRIPGCIAICTIGCGGDQRPDFCGGVDVAAAHAHEIGDEVARLLENADWQPVSGPINADLQRTELPLGPIPSGEELEGFARDQGLGASTVARAFVARHRLLQMQQGDEVPAGVPFAAQSWHFGGGPQLVFLTGEVCIDYQLQIKRDYGHDVWPVAYANATPCYIVSRRMLAKGGYEAGNSMFYYGWLRTLLPAAEDAVMECVAGVLGEQHVADLLEGDSLDQWKIIGATQDAWTLDDGVLICHGEKSPRHFLRTNEMYENFVLDVDWKLTTEGGNSGVFFYADALPQVGAPYPESVEVQILDGDHGSVFGIRGATIEPLSTAGTKGKTAAARPTEDLARPVGQWNHYRLTSRSGEIELAVNGKPVTRARCKDRRKGYIALQAEHQHVQFRNIRIQRLPTDHPAEEHVAQTDQGHAPLFNGVDFSGWKYLPGHRDHWIVDDGVIKYDGQASEAKRTDKDLWTTDSFAQFHLIADWRLPSQPTMKEHPVVLPNGDFVLLKGRQRKTFPNLDAGDSGIYFRGSTKAQLNIWSQNLGSGEINGYRTDRSLPAEVRLACVPSENADKPFGEWNRFAVTVRDDRVTVDLNDRRVIDRTRLPDLPKNGPLALQHHGDPVEFRNLFIRSID